MPVVPPIDAVEATVQVTTDPLPDMAVMAWVLAIEVLIPLRIWTGVAHPVSIAVVGLPGSCSCRPDQSVGPLV